MSPMALTAFGAKKCGMDRFRAQHVHEPPTVLFTVVLFADLVQHTKEARSLALGDACDDDVRAS